MKRVFQENKNKKGFSLVELIVVIAIMAIATAIVLNMPTSTRGGENLELAARDVAQLIRQTQNNALGGKMPVAGNNDTFACGYMFAYGTGSGNSYKLGYVNKSTGCASNPDATMGANVALKNGAEFDLPNDRALYFSIPQGNISVDNYVEANPKMPNTGLGAYEAISLESPTTGSLRADICVYASGKVEEMPLRDSNSDSTPNC